MSTTNEGIIPYGHQWIDDDDIAAVAAVLRSDFLTQGPETHAFEEEIRQICGARYCVAVSSATAALHIAIAALELGPESEGITTPITFLASANCLVYNGVQPRFADIDSKTYCISPAEVGKRMTERTRVIVPVDFAGQPADMRAIREITDKHNNCYIVEDAAHAIGSAYPDGKPVGSCAYSDMTVFSFHPVKTITTGEGGAITTNDEHLYRRLCLLRSHGMTKDPELLSENPGPWYYEMIDLGFNYRMTDIQAALGRSQLKKLALFKSRRCEIVERYNKALGSMRNITIPFEAPGVDSCFHLYVIWADFNTIGKSRASAMSELKDLGVGTQVHYIPVHTQPFYRKRFGYSSGDFPVAERYYRGALSLPLFPKMTDDNVQRVIEAVARVFA